MKDHEFIELLNLYLDHEISEVDAARLEAEVQRNPARYRIYREYCQMQKACALLSPAAISEAPATTAFEARPRRWATPFALGGFFAAAACATFLFLNRVPTSTPLSSESTVAAETPALVSPNRSEEPSPVSPTSENNTQLVSISLGRSSFQPPLATQTVRWNPGNPGVTSTTPNAGLKWIEALELTSVPQVPADSLRFNTKAISKDGGRNFGSGQLDAPIESTAAFQFQR